MTGEPPSILDNMKKHIKDSDLFVLLISPLGANLLRVFGTIVGTDATHKTVVYDKVKVIIVSCSSWDKSVMKSNHELVERGFPCVFADTTFEREDIHQVTIFYI